MRLRRAIVLAAATPLCAAAQTQEPLPSQGAGRIASQLVVGALAEPIGFVGGGLTFRRAARAFGADDDAAARVASVGAAIGTATAAAGAVSLIGARGPGRGRFPVALAGAAGGLGASGLLVLLNRKPDADPGRPCHLACIVTTAAIATLPSIGATLAYNASRHR